MTATLSLENVPEPVLNNLRERARRNQRSIEGEVLAILEAAIGAPHLTIEQVHQRVGALSLKTGPEATEIVREDRDAR